MPALAGVAERRRFARAAAAHRPDSVLSALMPLPTHLPHVIYATALTSLSIHLLATRRAGADARHAAEARRSILEGLASRLRAGERVEDDEMARIARLLREGEVKSGEGSSVRESELDWRAVLFGRGDKDDSLRTQSEERAVKEWDSSKHSTFVPRLPR